MTNEEIKSAVLAALRQVAPEVDPAELQGDVAIRQQVDLDSMDFLHFMLELHASLGVDVPEAAYPEMTTLDGCVSYLSAANPQLQAVKPGDR